MLPDYGELPQDQKDAEDKARADALRLFAAYCNVFDTPEGRIVLDDLIEQGGLYRCSHSPDDTDALATAFREGRRSMLLHILSIRHSKHSDDPDQLDLGTDPWR